MFGTEQPLPTRVYFGHANDPESLESATAKAAWLDEAGQKKFRLGSWEAIQRRLSINEGRALITTTPYDTSWLKRQIYEPWRSGDTMYDVIRFDSTENPAFPRAEFERARKLLPAWKFDLFYRAIFTRPAGLIYDSFDEIAHVVPQFPVPEHWQERYLGLDFGGINTVGLFYVRDPMNKHLYLYAEYNPRVTRTAAQHVAALKVMEPLPLQKVVGGSHSEDQWRAEFQAAGLAVYPPPIKDVEVGIDRVYGFHSRGMILVMSDMAGYLDEKMSYSREVDESGEPTDKIADQHAFHRCDAERYLMAWLHAHEDDGAMPILLGQRGE
jgi:hypothetical protein